MGSLPTKLRALSVEKPNGCWAVVPAGLGVKTHSAVLTQKWKRHQALECSPLKPKSLLNHSSAYPTWGYNGCGLCSYLPSRGGWGSQARSLTPHIFGLQSRQSHSKQKLYSPPPLVHYLVSGLLGRL